jgi:hypothetical protein
MKSRQTSLLKRVRRYIDLKRPLEARSKAILAGRPGKRPKTPPGAFSRAVRGFQKPVRGRVWRHFPARVRLAKTGVLWNAS